MTRAPFPGPSSKRPISPLQVARNARGFRSLCGSAFVPALRLRGLVRRGPGERGLLALAAFTRRALGGLELARFGFRFGRGLARSGIRLAGCDEVALRLVELARRLVVAFAVNVLFGPLVHRLSFDSTGGRRAAARMLVINAASPDPPSFRLHGRTPSRPGRSLRRCCNRPRAP